MRRRTGILLLMMMLVLMPGEISFASSSVKVTLPDFKVSLNGMVIENSYRQYPLIVYKGISYFPMTYYDSRFMGLESVWNSGTGLTIVKSDVNWEYCQHESSVKNNNVYTARVAPFKITVNGKGIDNSSEEYPLLLFRNVTYFPLTWRFAVDEFGWEYSFDENNGLLVNSSAGSAAAGQLTLPIVDREIGGKGAFTMAGDYFYYEGAGGKIYQVPVSNPSESREVYQLPLNYSAYFDCTYVLSSLQTDNGKAILKYHTGGATMGSDHLVWLREDGSSLVIDNGYSALKIYDKYTIRVAHGCPAYPNNLQLKETGTSEYVNVGDPDTCFGFFIVSEGEGKSARTSHALYLIDDEIYVLGYSDHYNNDNPANTTGIYRVNINSNETVRLCPEEAADFKIIDEQIYFTDRHQHLYRVPLGGGQAELLLDKAVGLYEVLRGKVYYSLVEDNQLYTIGSEDAINPGGKLNKLEVQNGYLLAIFDKESESLYKMMIINSEGKVLYKTIEDVLLVRIENGKVVFVKDN